MSRPYLILTRKQEKQAEGMIAEGHSIRHVARELGVGLRVTRRFFVEFEPEFCPCGRGSGHPGRCQARR